MLPASCLLSLQISSAEGVSAAAAAPTVLQ